MEITTKKPELAPALVAQITRIAKAEQRTPDELLPDMVSCYLKDQRWNKLVADAEQRGHGMPPKVVEAAVSEAIADYRKERAR